MRFVAKSLIFIAVCIILSTPFTQAKPSESVFFDNYDEDQGLIHSYVLSIFQDSRGILWVGTYGGVQAFNGYNFNLFNVTGKKSNILSNHVVNVIYEDKNKNIWFGTESGLNKYDLRTGHITQYLWTKGAVNCLSHNNVRTIYQDSEGVFWIGTYGGGLNKFEEKKNKFTHYKAKLGDAASLQSDLINAFFVDKNGLFWIGTENGGASVFDKTKNKIVQNFQKGTNGLSVSTVSAIYQDDYDNVWLGTWNGGLNKYNTRTGKFTYFLTNPNNSKELSGNNIRCILQTEKDFLWIATFGGGLYKFDLKEEKFTKIEVNTKKEGNSSQDLIWTLYRDNENNLWLGTFGKGLFKVNKLKNTFPYIVLRRDGDIKLSISSIIQDNQDNLWIGTLNKGIYQYDINKQLFIKFVSSKFPLESISELYHDSKDRIWIGADLGLYVIYPDRKTIRWFAHDPEKPTSISESAINSVLEDKEGNIWLGFWGMGINIIQHGELDKRNDSEVIFSKYVSQSSDTTSFLHNRIWNLFEDTKGTVWIGTSGELTYYTPEDKSFKSLPISVASSFYEDHSGYLWIGSIGNGLYKFDKNKQLVKKYGMEDGLPSLDILSILADRKGRLWLGTSVGLSVLDPQSENISNFDKNYGLQSFSISHNACTLLKSGEMVFGGNNGFNMFLSEEINQDFIKSPIIITDIKLNNKSIVYENVMDSSATIHSSIADLDTLWLDYKNKVLTIDFAAVNYASSSSITYAYKLEGFDEDWVVTDAHNRSVTYTNLTDGEYLFNIKMSYSKGKWNENSRKLRIIITSPFWKKIWFKFIFVLLILGVVWLVFRIRMGRTRLSMLINQKHNLAEKLTKEQELIQLRNDQLMEMVSQQNKKMASFGLKYQVMVDFISSIYQNLLDLRSTMPVQQNGKLSQVIRNLDEKIEDIGNPIDFSESINVLYDDFSKRFVEAYPRLTSTDLRICSFIRMNKSNKEIAKQLSITLGSLETSRHRIRKKIALPTEINLNDYILRF